MYGIVDPAQATVVSIDLFHRLDTAERPSRRGSSVGRRHAATLVLCSEQFEMAANFFIEVSVERAPAEQREHTREEHAK